MPPGPARPFPTATPDEIGERFAGLMTTGIDGFTVNAPANGHIEGRVALLGETLKPIVGL